MIWFDLVLIGSGGSTFAAAIHAKPCRSWNPSVDRHLRLVREVRKGTSAVICASPVS